ncbi:MAG: SDR family oxidoreductase [Nisaea sp.]|uniref:SDR family oxidoreductase n=1 Tax=Nisaea sp. TaxID=2024842 RepID=UPI001B03DD08|nr:SDR family oxidoreductase [Nisaea sp.]MBO6561433.1 SDR family oxidoreductase [Nisaea sp.]
MAKKKALVVGALGVIGRRLVQHLEEVGGWDIVGVSRRAPDFPTRAAHISVDLLDRADAEAKLGGLTDITHIFYTAFQARPTWAEHDAPNLAMLVNSVEPVAAASKDLEHVQLIEGNKIYGSHLGPFRTPAREEDPPHMLPNFYHAQESWLRAAQERQRWSWSALRPHTVCGFAVGNPMNISTCIAVYAAISKELGLPLRFPGKPGAWEAVYQVTDSALLARAMLFCATAESARNEVFNITNGDFFRWKNVWPKFAAHFDMELGDVQTIPLTEFMADKAPLWERMVEKYGLMKTPYADIAAWPFADYVFGTDWDVMTDTLKIRMAGFHDYVRSEEMFLDLFEEFRARKAIP